MADRLLTFELSKDAEQLEIHGNEEGLKFLREVLDRLLSEPSSQEHSHLMTDAWGGTELSAQKQVQDGRLLNMVTIYLWPKS